MKQAAVASALADAMLCGSAEANAVRARCAEVLGQNPSWLYPLAQAMVKLYREFWTAAWRDELVESILEHRSFRRAREDGEAYSVRKYFILHPAMGSLPQALSSCVLPQLADSRALAEFLGVPIDDLQWLSGASFARPHEHYVYRWLRKRSMGYRLLEMPKARLRAVQRRVLHGLLDEVPAHEAAHGFRISHSIVTHAQAHVGRRVVLRIDLKDFFLSIGSGRVKSLFRTLGYPPDLAATLTGLCTNTVPSDALSRRPSCDSAQHGLSGSALTWKLRQRYQSAHLPQGAPSSPALANLCAFRLDLRLGGLATKFDATYSRYADDLTFSGDARLLRCIERFIARVAAIASDEGFAVNFRKTRVMTQSRRQQVTGVVVNQKTNLRRIDFDTLKATLHNCIRHGPSAENRHGHAQFQAHLTGRVAHASMLNSVRGRQLRELLDRIDWSR